MSDLEVEPAAASELFGDRLPVARAFTEALAREGEERGLIGPLELPRLWTRHILNSAIAAPLFHGSVADIGSGAGLPGIVIAVLTRRDDPEAERDDTLVARAAELALDALASAD